MEKTIIHLDFYSELLQNDVTLSLEVRFEKVEESNIDECEKFGTKTTESTSFEAQFLSEDVTILNRDIPYSVSKEFYDQIEGYTEEIQEQINEEIN